MSESITHIDKNRLDEECERHQDLYEEYAIMLADAKEAFNRLDAKVDLAKAEVELLIRDNPKAFDISKVSEAAIKAAVIASDTYQEKIRLRIRAQKRVDTLTVIVRGMEHRKTMIEKLCELDARGYYARPTPKGDYSEVRRKKKKKSVDGKLKLYKPKKGV